MNSKGSNYIRPTVRNETPIQVPSYTAESQHRVIMQLKDAVERLQERMTQLERSKEIT